MLRLCLVCSFFCVVWDASAAKPSPTAVSKEKKIEVFRPFTGKIKGNKVRIRLSPDLESPIFKQVDQNELVLVVGEDGDFYAIQPPKNVRAYIFRSYVLNDTIEANRVNVRLQPHVEAPIIGQLQAGEKVQGKPAATNHKWLEITPPKDTHFFIAKEFVSHAGDVHYLSRMEEKKAQVEELLNDAFIAAEAECKKDYTDMEPDLVTEKLQKIIREFVEFPYAVSQAKKALVLLKDTYLTKKIEYLEKKTELSENEKANLIAQHQAEHSELLPNEPTPLNTSFWEERKQKQTSFAKNSRWDALEECLYQSWIAFQSDKNPQDFYQEQRANATTLKGKIEPYDADVEDKPGDYILRTASGPVAFLYSTAVDLKQYEGKVVSLLVSPRPNHHFAFPAYFVMSAE